MTISIWEVALCICIGLIGFCLGALVMISVAKRDLKKIRLLLTEAAHAQDNFWDNIPNYTERAAK